MNNPTALQIIAELAESRTQDERKKELKVEMEKRQKKEELLRSFKPCIDLVDSVIAKYPRTFLRLHDNLLVFYKYGTSMDHRWTLYSVQPNEFVLRDKDYVLARTKTPEELIPALISLFADLIR
jgi:hypothetical protein